MNAPTADEQDTRDMTRLVEGHDSALNDLMQRHAEKLFHYLIRSLQNEDDASDLAQETFAKVYHSREKFDRNQKFATWLYAIASNLVRDRYRWRTRHPQVSLDLDNEETDASLKENLRTEEPAPDEQLQSEERAAAVPRLRLFYVHQPQVRLVDQRRGLSVWPGLSWASRWAASLRSSS